MLVKTFFALPARWITTGTYIMSNGRKAYIDSIKPNGQGVGSYESKPDASGRIRRYYWVWEAEGNAKFIERSELDLVKKL
jgi:hypothetical protein